MNYLLSILDFLKCHNAVDGWGPLIVVLLALSGLHSLTSLPNVVVLRPVSRNISLNLTPLENMNFWEIFGWLSNHNVELTSLLIHFCWLECFKIRFILWNEFIPHRTEVVIICVINKAKIGIVQSLNQCSLCTLLSFVPRSRRIGFVEHVWSTHPSVYPAKQPVPSQKSVIPCETTKFDWVHIFEKTFAAVILYWWGNLLFDWLICGSCCAIFCFLGQLSYLLEFLPHALFNWPLSNQIEFDHSLLNANGILTSQPQPWILMIPDRNQRRDPTSSLILWSGNSQPMLFDKSER